MLSAAVQTALPAACLPAQLPPVPGSGRLLIVGAGKSAGAMAEVAEAHYLAAHGRQVFAPSLDEAKPGQIFGRLTTRYGYTKPTTHMALREASHPIPDAQSAEGAQEAVAIAHAATPDDTLLVLLSGGASALWCAPAAGLTLADKQAVTDALLKGGEPIGAINAVRKHLSAIKGGRLAAAAGDAQLITLAISDVPGDAPDAIGSGPTVGDRTTMADAAAALERVAGRLGDELAAKVTAALSETPGPDAPQFARARYEIIAKPAAGLDAAADIARRAGFTPVILGDDLEGEARDVAAAHCAMAAHLAGGADPAAVLGAAHWPGDAPETRGIALLSGGELTVTVRGNGRGGPNQEYALAAAEALSTLDPRTAQAISLIAADTDGSDGGTGAADDAAGALVTGETLSQAAKQRLDPSAFLADNDATGFFEAVGDVIKSGPTFTNINDFRAVLISRD
ncbi:MAG: DUF4147 domain-containing protein [Pseudomonadota bacterium]